MSKIIVKEGMPRKGWNTVDIIDHKTISYTCELCGAKIRHEHIQNPLTERQLIEQINSVLAKMEMPLLDVGKVDYKGKDIFAKGEK